MIRKKIVGLILASILLIGFTVYSIVSEDLTTVQMILGKTTETASTEISQNEDEVESSVDENTIAEGILGVNEPVNNVVENNLINETLSNEITENNTSEIDSTVSVMSMAGLTSENPVDEQEVSVSGDESTASSSRPKKVIENSTLQVASEQTNTSVPQNIETNKSINTNNELTNNNIKNLNSNNVANNKLNTSNTSNTTVNQNKLPAAGATRILIWLLLLITVIAIISIISNIKYRDIPLK